MRWFVLLLVLSACGCVETQREVQRVYVCPDQSEVDRPDQCVKAVEATSTTVAVAATSTTVAADSTVTTSQTTSTTHPDSCVGLSVYKRAACVAVRAGNASMCPFGGLEYSWETLSTSVFLTLGEDKASEEQKALILDVFRGNETCVMAIINSYDSSSMCEASPYRQLCLEKFIVDADDAGACGRITQGSMQQGCYFALIRLRNNFDACLKYPEYDDCLVKAAAERNDIRLCQKVYGGKSDEELAARCVLDVKMQMCMDAEGSGVDCCAPLPDSIRGICYSQKLRTTNDTMWCRKKAGSGVYEEDWGCYSQLAQRSMDSGICDEIMSVTWHDDCYRQMASTTGNSTLCEKITDDLKRRNCERKG